VIRQYIRLGTHAEAEFLRKLPQTFDGLVLNANLVQGTPAASASLVYALQKPYLLDPFTHAFASAPRFLQSRQKDKKAAVVPKRTFVGLGEAYFGNSDFVGKSALAPADVNSTALAEASLRFQTSWFEREFANDEFINKGALQVETPLAPYFPVRADFGWLDFNLAVLRRSLELDENSAAVVAISQHVLRDCREKIVEAYSETKVSRVFLWVENFDEDRAEVSDLRHYLSLVRRFSAAGIDVCNAFGGFFSCLAESAGLKGFIHGLVYGENKGFAPVLGGGQPPPRFYFRPAHVAMSVPEAELLLADLSVEEYLSTVCDCLICSRLISQNGVQGGLAKFAEVNEENKFTPTAYAYSRFHFLLARRKEVRRTGAMDHVQRLEYLKLDQVLCAKLGAIDFASHLGRWIKVIGE
jgi:hypothetical protein